LLRAIVSPRKLLRISKDIGLMTVPPDVARDEAGVDEKGQPKGARARRVGEGGGGILLIAQLGRKASGQPLKENSGTGTCNRVRGPDFGSMGMQPFLPPERDETASRNAMHFSISPFKI